MTIITIDYDQLAPIMFFVGLLIGYFLRKCQKKRTGTILRTILFLLIFVVTFLISRITTLVALCAMFVCLGILTVLTDNQVEKYIAYTLTLVLTSVSILAAFIILGQYNIALLFLLRVLTVGTACLVTILPLSTTKIVRLAGTLTDNTVTGPLLLSLLIFRRVLSVIADFKISFEIHSAYLKSVKDRIRLFVHILEKRLVPIFDKIADDVATALVCRGIDFSKRIRLRFYNDITKIDVGLFIIIVLAILLLCLLL